MSCPSPTETGKDRTSFLWNCGVLKCGWLMGGFGRLDLLADLVLSGVLLESPLEVSDCVLEWE